MKDEEKATTEPLTLEVLRAEIKRMEEEPPRPDIYLDGPWLRWALGIEEAPNETFAYNAANQRYQSTPENDTPGIGGDDER